MSRAESSIDQARLLFACAEHSGDWLHAPPITAVGLRLNDEMVRISIATRLGARTCEPHTCPCGKEVDARGLHGLSCRKSAARHIRHAHLNDIIWSAVKRAQIPAVKEPVGLSRADGKRPDGATSFHGQEERRLRGMSPWPILSPFLALVTLQYKQVPLQIMRRRSKCSNSVTNIFVPVAIETGVA